MSFTLSGLIFNVVGVLALMRSEWLQKQPPATSKKHSRDRSGAESLLIPADPDAAFSLWMLGGLALVFGFCLHIAALFQQAT